MRVPKMAVPACDGLEVETFPIEAGDPKTGAGPAPNGDEIPEVIKRKS